MRKNLTVFCYLGMYDITIQQTLKPFIDLKEIKDVFIFRTRTFPGPKLDKCRYILNKYPKKFNLINIIIEFLQSLILARKFKPDMIISYYLKPHGVIALLVGKILNIPINYNVMSGPEEFKLLRTNKKKGRDQKSKILENILISLTKQFDSITTTGMYTKNYLIESGITDEKIRILPDSVDLERFSPKSKEKSFDLIFVARFDPIKHHDSFIEILSRIKSKYPNVKAALVGNGPQLPNVRKLVLDLGLEKNVYFLGHKSNVEEYYNLSKLLVMCSEREGFPMVVLEAMGCGLPCVVSKVGDIMDLINDGENGFVIEDYRDIDSFASRCIQLLDNQDIYNKISFNAIKSVNQHFSYSAASNVWDKILNKI